METDLVDIFRFLGARAGRLSERRTHLHDAIHSYADSVERDGFIRLMGLAISLVCGCVVRCAMGPGNPGD